MRRLIFLVVGLLAACGSVQEPAKRYPMLRTCRLAGLDEDVLCGTLAVAENRKAPGGRTINLRVVVLPSLKKAAGDPMFVLAGGGPGISSVVEAPGVAQAWATVRPIRDVVLIDQRGTGGSNPLDCALGQGVEAVRGFFAGEIPLDRLRACREQLAANADLSAYTTFDAADDLEDVRRWLHADRINLYGASYTSRLAIVYAQRHPSRVRTLILKAPMPFAVRNPVTLAADAQRALDRLFNDCAADPACQTAYPTLREDFRSLWERLANDPPAIDFKGQRLVLSRDLVAGALRRALMSADTQRAIPAILSSMARGDFSAMSQSANMAGAIDRFLNLGLFLSVTCAEDVRWYSVEEAKTLSRDTFSGPRMAEALKQVCGEWPAAALPQNFASHSVVNVPTLIMAGALDPQTPIKWAHEAARSFHAATVVEIPNMAHSGPNRCVAVMIAALVYSGNTKEINTLCAKTGARPPFVVPGSP